MICTDESRAERRCLLMHYTNTVIYSAIYLTLNCGAKGVNVEPKHTIASV